MIKLSISIVNFNTKNYLKKCLESIERNVHGIDYEVIVADNNSRDSSVEMLRRDYPWVYTIANKDNLGAPIAKNQTFKQAKGKYILILDSDIEILPGAIEEMLNFMDKHPKVGILGPSVMFPDNKPQHSCNKSVPTLWSAFGNKFFFFANLRYRFYRSTIGYIYLKKRYRQPEKFIWLGGMCLLVRKEVIQQLHGIDEKFFIYFDDTDFCLRANNAGWKVYYLPSASVIHYMSKGVGQFNTFLYPKMYEGELYFFKKHYGKFQMDICALFTQISMVLRIFFVVPLFLIGIKRDLRKRICAYWHVICLAGSKIYGKAD